MRRRYGDDEDGKEYKTQDTNVDVRWYGPGELIGNDPSIEEE